jgi:hypothetical protein
MFLSTIEKGEQCPIFKILPKGVCCGKSGLREATGEFGAGGREKC